MWYDTSLLLTVWYILVIKQLIVYEFFVQDISRIWLVLQMPYEKNPVDNLEIGHRGYFVIQG